MKSQTRSRVRHCYFLYFPIIMEPLLFGKSSMYSAKELSQEYGHRGRNPYGNGMMEVMRISNAHLLITGTNVIKHKKR